MAEGFCILQKIPQLRNFLNQTFQHHQENKIKNWVTTSWATKGLTLANEDLQSNYGQELASGWVFSGIPNLIFHFFRVGSQKIPKYSRLKIGILPEMFKSREFPFLKILFPFPWNGRSRGIRTFCPFPFLFPSFPIRSVLPYREHFGIFGVKFCSLYGRRTEYLLSSLDCLFGTGA